KTYVSRLAQYFVFHEVSQEKRVSAILLFMGTSTFQLLENAIYPARPQDKTYDEIVKSVEELLNPAKSKFASRIAFHKLIQQSGESIQVFASRLRKSTVNCGWNAENLNENLEQFVGGLDE